MAFDELFFTDTVGLACGTGFVLAGIAKVHPKMALHGSEIFLDELTVAATRWPDLQFMQMDARCLPYRDEFDVIGGFDVLSHIEQDEVVLAQL